LCSSGQFWLRALAETVRKRRVILDQVSDSKLLTNGLWGFKSRISLLSGYLKERPAASEQIDREICQLMLVTMKEVLLVYETVP